MGHHPVMNDALVMWSGVKINDPKNAQPPTCEWSTPGFVLPEKISALQTKFKASFGMTLQTFNSQASVPANIFWLGELDRRVAAAYVIGNTDHTAMLRVEWGAGTG